MGGVVPVNNLDLFGRVRRFAKPVPFPDYEAVHNVSPVQSGSASGLDWLGCAKFARQRWRQYRGTSLIRNRLHLGPYSRAMPGALWWS